MTDKEYVLQKKRVSKYLDKWQAPMGLKWWDIDIVWSRVYNENRGVAATTDMNNWRYRQATITFYLPNVALETEDSVIEQLVVHELTHVLLSIISVNMRDLNDDYQHDLMEFNTDLVADAFLWVRRAGAKDNKKG